MGKYTKFALTLNFVIFLIIFFVHVFRIITGFSVKIGGWEVSIWLNVLFAILAAILVYLNYKSL